MYSETVAIMTRAMDYNLSNVCLLTQQLQH